MYELLLLTKSGREIAMGQAENKDEAQNLANAAVQLLGGLKTAQELNNVMIINSGPNVYFIVPSEIEGISLFHVEETPINVNIQEMVGKALEDAQKPQA
jgi:hypothetical protein